MAEISQQHNAIRARVWLAGKFITRDPVPIQITPQRFETKTKTSNLATRVDRCLTVTPDGVMPNIRNRRGIAMPWSDIREPAMLEHLDIVTALGQPFPLILWKQEYDIFDGDGQNQTFYLQRRLALCAPGGAIPDVVPQDWQTRVLIYSGSYLDSLSEVTEIQPTIVPQADIDTGSPEADVVWISKEGQQFGNLWVNKCRFGTAPPSASDNVIVIYVPLYECVIDTEQPKSFAQSLVEPRSLKFAEFG